MIIGKFKIQNSKFKILLAQYSVLVVILIASILRLWNLEGNPPHLTPDETALGYNAYLILKTGKDEYGEFLPLILKSFGDYKPGLYVYLTVPFVAIFGLGEFAVRLPSALAGIMSVLLVYLVVSELFAYGRPAVKAGLGVTGDEKMTSDVLNRGKLTALTASFLLAISPWHVHFSRGAWEVNVALTLTLAGIYFFLQAFRSPKFLVLCSGFFASTFLVYQGAKLATPIVLLVLAICYWKEVNNFFRKYLSTVVASTALALIIVSPIFISIYKGETGRLEVFSVFSYPRPEEYIDDFISPAQVERGSLTYNLFYSEPLNFVRGIMGRYFNHFSGRFLFFEGDYQNPRHSAPYHGMLHLAELIFLLAGFVAVLSTRNRIKYFILLWLILVPLPAVLSRDQVQAVRSFNMIIPLTLVSSFGLIFFTSRIKSFSVKRLRVTIYAFLFIAYFTSFIYFLDSYFVHLPIKDAKHWNWGYREVSLVLGKLDQNTKVHFQQSYAQPYIYYLFYNKYDPAGYQTQATLTRTGPDVGLIERLDNIHFRPLGWPVSGLQGGDVVILEGLTLAEDLITEDFELVSKLMYPDQREVAFWILRKK